MTILSMQCEITIKLRGCLQIFGYVVTGKLNNGKNYFGYEDMLLRQSEIIYTR